MSPAPGQWGEAGETAWRESEKASDRGSAPGPGPGAAWTQTAACAR